jgi:release factor glutamine methyltransferase
MNSMSYREALRWASSSLYEQQHYEKIAEWLLLSLTNWQRSELLLQMDQPVPAAQMTLYQSWIARVLSGEPYQYVLGEHDFFGRAFHVSPAVLIPRPETELLVEQTIKHIKQLDLKKPIQGIDVGTGSGVIAITLCCELEGVEMIGVDISEQALQIAQQNCKRWNAPIQLQHSDMLSEVLKQRKKLQLIVSNPPYIPEDNHEGLSAQVLQHEPHEALFAAEGGLLFYRTIIEQSQAVLQKPGLLAFEVGIGQAEQVKQLILQYYPEADCQMISDYQGIPRVVIGKIM